MKAVGIDLGGTKIETQVFDDTWSLASRRRCETPSEYSALVQVMADQIAWAEKMAGGTVPVGVGAAGLINPVDGLALTANLPATGKAFPSAIENATDRAITYVNDCRALALSEAVFGQGKGHKTVMALILGTGIGGGVCVDGRILEGPTRTGGEFGHTSAPAHILQGYDIPVIQCGCGRFGCIETYIAGPGMSRIAKHITGETVTPPQIAEQRFGTMQEVWKIWCALTADLLHTLTLTVDPDIIVLGGGLSQIEGLTDDLTKAAQGAQLLNYATPPLVLAEGGNTSGARGAALAAWQAVQDG